MNMDIKDIEEGLKSLNLPAQDIKGLVSTLEKLDDIKAKMEPQGLPEELKEMARNMADNIVEFVSNCKKAKLHPQFVSTTVLSVATTLADAYGMTTKEVLKKARKELKKAPKGLID
jgi:septation ring formation regulator EzrA